jgi:hypothetical protein
MTEAPGLTWDNTHLSEASQATASLPRNVQLIAKPAIDCLRRVEAFVADSLTGSTRRAYRGTWITSGYGAGAFRHRPTVLPVRVS